MGLASVLRRARGTLVIPLSPAVWAALGGILVLTLCVLREPLLWGRAFYERDVLSLWLPECEGFVRSVRAGAWPLWNPDLSFGRPLLAQANGQVCYPPAWLSLVLDRTTAYSVLVGVHLLAAMVGAFLLGRRWGLSCPASFTAAATWGLSGPYLSCLNLWNHFMAAAWVPWVVLAAEGILCAPSVRGVLCLGGLLAAPLLAGSPDVCVMIAVLLGGLAVTGLELRSGQLGRSVRTMGALTLAGLLAAALTAIAWWPALETARRALRWDLPEATRTYWSLHPVALLFTALPLAAMDLPWRPDLRDMLFEGREWLLYSMYLGMPALGLALAGFLGRPHARRRLLAVVALLGTLVALGRHTPVYAAIAFLIPPVRSLRYPVKALVFVAFACALLAGMGVDAFRGAAASTRRRRYLLVVGPTLLLLTSAVGLCLARTHGERIGLSLFVPLEQGDASPAQALRQMLSPLLPSALLLAAAVATAAIVLLRPTAGRKAGVILGCLAAAELLLVHKDLNPTAPSALAHFRAPQIGTMLEQQEAPRTYVFVYDDAQSLRLLGHRKGLFAQREPPGWPYALAQALALQMYAPPPRASAFGVSGSYDPDPLRLYPRELSELVSLARQAEGPALVRLLQLGAVTHVVALHTRGLETLVPVASYESLFEEPIRLYRVPRPLPRVYAVGAARVEDGPAAIASLLDPGFDPAEEVVLAEGTAVQAAGFSGRAKIVARRPDFVRIDADLGQPGFVVLVEGFDPGWRARVDGRPVRVLRANVAFRAVPVPSGRHVVELTYRPSSVVVGAFATGFALLACLVTLTVATRRRSRETRAAP